MLYEVITCPSEEQMIRMRLADMDNVDKLDFDLAARMLTVYHSGTHDEILKRLDGLQLNTSLVSSNETEQDIHLPDDHTTERKLLIQVLIINLSFFILELITGYVASSMGLIADGLDMLADSIVYALALMAVGSTMVRKKKIATLAGYFQLLLAIVGFAEVVRRFTGTEENPAFLTMILVSVLALMGNAFVITSYSIHYTKLYDKTQTCHNARTTIAVQSFCCGAGSPTLHRTAPGRWRSPAAATHRGRRSPSSVG